MWAKSHNSLCSASAPCGKSSQEEKEAGHFCMCEPMLTFLSHHFYHDGFHKLATWACLFMSDMAHHCITWHANSSLTSSLSAFPPWFVVASFLATIIIWKQCQNKSVLIFTPGNHSLGYVYFRVSTHISLYLLLPSFFSLLHRFSHVMQNVLKKVGRGLSGL